jgi:cytochrome b6-f complex iron-sulfur subunit
MESRLNRREFIRSTIATVTIMAVGATGVFEIASKAAANQASAQQQHAQLSPVSAESGQASTSSQSTSATGAASSQPSSSAVPAGYVLVAQASTLAGKTSAYFNHPSHGSSMLIELNGQWKAFSAICTHRPCTLEYASSEIYCPCHGATFSASNGSVTRGPAQVSLGEYGVLQQNGGVYVTDSVIN